MPASHPIRRKRSRVITTCPEETLDSLTKDLIQISAWMVAAVGGVIAALKAIHELRENRRQRAEELRWRKANAAKELLDLFYADDRFRDALMMLDWDGRPFALESAGIQPITHQDLLAALDIDTVSFTATEVFIRTCMDRLFEAFERIEHAIRTNVIEYEDVRFAFEFYICRLAPHRDLVTRFMRKTGFENALAFFDRCEGWRVAFTDRHQAEHHTAPLGRSGRFDPDQLHQRK